MPDSPFNADAVKAALVQMMADAPTEAVAAPPAKKSHAGMHASLGVMAGGQAADLITTLAALKKGGFKEGNPVLGQNPAGIAAIKSGVMALVGWLLDKKLHDQHPKLAKGLALGLGGLGSAAAMHNVSVMRKAR